MFAKEAAEYFDAVGLEDPEMTVLLCGGTKGITGKGEYTYTYILAPSPDHTKITL